MALGTPQLLRVRARLQAEFPGIKFGIYNRRKIAGSTSWSQHSWPNALDIFFTNYGDTSPPHQAQLDRVYTWLRIHRHELQINYNLWRRLHHWDHIHIDFWPKGWGYPSVTPGGIGNRYRHKDGTIITQAQLTQEEEDDLAILTDAEQLELRKFLGYINSKESNVSFAAHAIQLIRDHRAGGPLAPAPVLDLDDYEIIIKRREV